MKSMELNFFVSRSFPRQIASLISFLSEKIFRQKIPLISFFDDAV